MGTKGQELLGNNLGKVIELLNKAYADEWLAYYQYWVGAKVVEGPMSDALIAELIEHANDELRHADMVAERIVKLGGTPVLEPKKWYDFTNCGYESPEDPYTKKVLEQNISGEQCAIDVYNKLQKFTRDIDPVTYNVAMEILTDEIEHEDDLQALLEEFEDLKKKFR